MTTDLHGLMVIDSLGIRVGRTATGGDRGALTCNPETLSFGKVQLGDSIKLKVRLINVGGWVARTSLGVPTNNVFSSDTTAFTIEPGDTVWGSITFHPRDSTPQFGRLQVSVDANGLAPTLVLLGVPEEPRLQLAAPFTCRSCK